MSPKECLQATVVARINGNRKHGWGVDDSLAVIAALFANEVGEAADEKWLSLVKHVINPSQFRQTLESEKLLDKSETKRARREKLFAEFNVNGDTK